MKLDTDRPRGKTITGIVLILSGISLCFLSMFIALFFDLTIGFLMVLLGAVIALWGLPRLMNELALVFMRGGEMRLIEQHSTWYKIIPKTRKWDMKYVSGVEAKIIKDEHQYDHLVVSLKFKKW